MKKCSLNRKPVTVLIKLVKCPVSLRLPVISAKAWTDHKFERGLESLPANPHPGLIGFKRRCGSIARNGIFDFTRVIIVAPEKTHETGLSPLAVSGITLTAVGGGALIAAMATGLITRNLDSDLAENCTDGNCPPGEEGKISKMESMRLSTNILLISGGAVAAVGLPLLIVGLLKSKKDKQAAELTIVPSLNPTFNGLFIERRF